MSETNSTPSARLQLLSVKAHVRNPLAGYLQAMAFFPVEVARGPMSRVDLEAQYTIESSICWRDPMLASPQIRERARR